MLINGDKGCDVLVYLNPPAMKFMFLHGFLGSSEDWIPIMKGLSRTAKCISFDLPGHGKSKIQSCDGFNAAEDVSLSIEVIAAILSQLIDKTAPRKVTLVGYSMGERIALYMGLRFSGKETCMTCF